MEISPTGSAIVARSDVNGGGELQEGHANYNNTVGYANFRRGGVAKGKRRKRKDPNKNKPRLLVVAVDNSDLQIHDMQFQALVAQVRRNIPMILVAHYGLHLTPLHPRNEKSKFVLCGDPDYHWNNDRTYSVEKLRTRWNIESNSAPQQNLIGYLIANRKRNLTVERESKIHIPSW